MPGLYSPRNAVRFVPGERVAAEMDRLPTVVPPARDLLIADRLLIAEMKHKKSK